MLLTAFVANPAVLVAVSAILVFVAGGFLAWRAKSGEIWEAVAEGYKAQVEQRDALIVDLRAEVAAATVRIAALEAQVEQFKGRDQAAVLKALEHHETKADERAAATQAILERVASVLEGGQA